MCYNNDLPSLVSFDIRLFVDDCLIYRLIKEEDLKLEHWVDIWGMKFIPSKCSVLRVKRPRAKEIASDYQLKGFKLGKVSNSPYLESASVRAWNGGITSNSTVGFLRRNLNGCPSKFKEIAYFAMVLEYSRPVWDPYRQGDIDKLSKIQRARFVTNNSQRKSSVTAVIQDPGWTDLQIRRN